MSLLLKLSATLANEVGVARFLVDGGDLKDVAAVYGYDPEKIKEATPGWLDRFALGEIQFFPGLAGLGTGLGSRSVFRDCQRCNRRLKLYP